MKEGAQRLRLPAVLLAACLAAGCAQLLPKARSEVSSPWASFEEAREAIDHIVPYRTTAEDLRAAGIDPYFNPNVQLLTFSDVMLRFPASSDSNDHLEAGLRECLQSGRACRGYAITAKNLRRERVGSFWLDALSFKRVTETTGWTFNALVLLVNDQVVYTLYGGQPRVHETETARQPLGPVQSFGEALPDLLK
jgi:hypothetical protein